MSGSHHCMDYGKRQKRNAGIAGMILCCALFHFSMIPPAMAEEPLLEIEEAVWTDGVRSYQYDHVFTDTAPVAPLFLWMRIKGTSWALEQLQKEGKLPIYHKWYRYSIIGVSAEGVTEMIDKIKIPAGSGHFIHKLELELSSRGYFDWRTWSMKRNIRRGKWIVKVVYADNTAVMCGEDHPCEYMILVR